MTENTENGVDLAFEEESLGRYLEMQKPHESIGELDSAMKSFFDDVLRSRVKHGIADVHVIILANALAADGQIGTMQSSAHFGLDLNAEPMCAWSLGREQRQRQDRIAAAIGPRQEEHRRQQLGRQR